jgi:hypothetical protein
MKESNYRAVDKKGPCNPPNSRENHHKQWLLAHVAINGVFLHNLDDGLHSHDDHLAYALCHDHPLYHLYHLCHDHHLYHLDDL